MTYRPTARIAAALAAALTCAAAVMVVATPAQAAKSYTMKQVAKNASAKSCWTVINGNVYDLTRWVSRHPGGSRAILSLCGKDGTRAFTSQHGMGGGPAGQLAGFKIGTLRK